MRKYKKGRKFSREKDQRRALMQGLASSLILHEQIETTTAKAKSLRPFVEKLITKGKKESLSTRRLITKYLPKETAKKLFDEIGPRYKERAGGYTRIIKLAPRQSDGAEMAVIQLV